MSLDKQNISKEEISKVLRRVHQCSSLISDDDTAVIFYDVDFIEERIKNVIEMFPSTALHAIAVKANPLVKILERIKNLNVGVEVASDPELFMAQKMGFLPNKIVFDSPSKTVKEIEYALKLGASINADSFEELDRIGKIISCHKSSSRIGVRINPQVGIGSIESTSVAGVISKFGIPLDDNYEELINYIRLNQWIRCVHVHIGSQGCPVPLLISGLRKGMDFILDVNSKLNNQIEVFDIGGGLPVSYHDDNKAISVQEYCSYLKTEIPELFDGRIKIVTEFGRYIHANAGWALSKVEYVKREKGYNIIMTHLGADLLLRKCYNPNDWHHQISVVDRNGIVKTGIDTNMYIVAGPLCFAGDVIAKDIKLARVETGDYIIIHDIGAYTLSMWSRYNSRQIPKVIGYSQERNDFAILKEREDYNEVFNFWS